MSETVANPRHKYATAQEAAEAYAADKPTLLDGLYKNVPVGRIGTTSDGTRRIFNFPFKTVKSGDVCASMGYPLTGEYAQSFHDQYGDIMQGDLVDVTVENGYVKRIKPSKAINFASISINKAVVEQTEEAVDEETGEVFPIGSSADDDAAALLAARKAAGKSEGTQAKEGEEDLPL
jgi:hypothetical protein